MSVKSQALKSNFVDLMIMRKHTLSNFEAILICNDRMLQDMATSLPSLCLISVTLIHVISFIPYENFAVSQGMANATMSASQEFIIEQSSSHLFITLLTSEK